MIAEHSLVVLDCDPPHGKLNRGMWGRSCTFTRAVADTRWNSWTAPDGRWRSSPLALTMFGQLKPANCFMLDAPDNLSGNPFPDPRRAHLAFSATNHDEGTPLLIAG